MILTTEGAGQVPSWCSWAHGKLKLDRSNLCYLDILTALTSSRCSKTLSIELPSSSTKLKFDDPIQLEQLYCHIGPVHDCIRDHLIEAHINEFAVNINMISLVESLLLKAEHLKRLVIHKKANAFERDHDKNISLMDIIKKIPHILRKCQIWVMDA